MEPQLLLPTVNSMKAKTGETEGRTCADGRKQCDFIGKEDSASLTGSTEAVLSMTMMEAKESRKVATCDTLNTFI